MKLDLKKYTAKQYAAILLRDDFNYSCRQISEILNMTPSGVRYIFYRLKR
jgi:DNA-directed RNA polymerase specialized sigma24 family protein